MYNIQKSVHLTFLIDQLNDTQWSDIYKLDVIKEYEKFLSLRSNNNKLSPSNDVDIVWHQHILNTKHYREYCITKFGLFIDHDPIDSFDQNARKSRLKNTVDVYKTKFGIPHPRTWKESTDLLISNEPKQNKKIIWYNNKELYDDYKQKKEVLKIIFTVSGSVKYNGTTIMYLAKNDMTLKELSDIIDERTNMKSDDQKIRWLTKDPKQSYNTLINKTKNNSTALRHLVDVEPDNIKISHYYNNRIELDVRYHHPKDGC